MLNGDALGLRQKAHECSTGCRRTIPRLCTRSAKPLPGTDPLPLAAFLDTINVWLSQRLEREQADQGQAGASRRDVGADQYRGA